MAIISSVGSKIGEYASKGFGALGKNKKISKLCDKFYEDPIKYVGYATLASLATKDAVGCYLYVTQSLNNKKIPEDKRRFVANMDLTNGILNVITQIGLTFGLKKAYDPIFNKMLKKSFNSKAVKELITAMRRDSKAANEATLRKLEATENLEKLRKNIKSSFSAVMDIFVATIIAKRCVVPFLSTPLTQYFTNRHDKKMAEKNALAQQDKKEEPAASAKDVKPVDISSTGNSNLLAKFQH